MSDYPMLISNKLHSFRNFSEQMYTKNNKAVFYAAENPYFFSKYNFGKI